MATLVDTNVLIDVFNTGGAFEDWSVLRLAEARRNGVIVINPLIYAEMAAGFILPAALEAAMPPGLFIREDLPWDAAYLAGHAFLRYRKAGGEKRSPLPDFYIGAHALIRGYTLLTRDAGRYMAYFPALDIISPDTHP